MAECRIDESVKVHFVIGGVNWKWSNDAKVGWIRTKVPYSDTVPLTHLGIKKLTKDWQSFECLLPQQLRLVVAPGSEVDIAEGVDRFQSVQVAILPVVGH